MDLGAFVWIDFGIALLMLLIGSYHDFQTRTVPNKVWIVFGFIGGLVAVYQYGLTVLLGIHLLFAAVLGGGMYIAWRFYAKFIGGADVKAIMALGVILSPLAYLVAVFALFVGTVVLLTWAGCKKLQLKEILEVKAPFIPFLLIGAFICLVFLSVA